ncbi:MAG: recombinase family protein, partial [Oscillospiraceae bacterium]|nr:recombinase family protein [Oscillospiraceae bacterium]
MADRVVTVIPARKTFARASETNVLRVAAYARVSTDSDEQMGSVAAQKDYFEKLIQKRPDWVLVDIYADEGISGTSLNRREAFNRMIADALAGKIDLIITKSLSRFARNTVDTLNTIRKLKIEGVGVYFEKEDINTLDSKGEFLITLMSSLAEEESRSISENVKWGHRKRFADGKYYMPYKQFLGYNKGPEGTPILVEEEAKIIRMIYRAYLCGLTTNAIAKQLTLAGIPSPSGLPVWQRSTVDSILHNEKYYGAALMQKRYCVDFRTKQMKKNTGELPQYYVENSHEPIVTKEIYNEVQRRLFKTRRANCSTTTFANLLLCHDCGGFLMALPAHSTTYNDNMWRCANRHIRNSACSTPYLYEELLITIFRKITLSLLEINPGIVRECVTALKAVSSTPTAFKKSKIIDAVATCVSGSEAEKNLWRTIMRKVVVHPEHFLEFHIMDGTILPYQM